MRYIFIFLLSSGFVGGAMVGIKKSLRSFLAIFFTLCLFVLVFPPVYSSVLKSAPFKSNLEDIVCEQTENFPLFSLKCSSVEEYKKYLEQGGLPSFLSNFLIQKGEKYFDTTVPCEVIINQILSNEIYNILCLLVCGIVLFILIYVLISFLLRLAFMKYTPSSRLFVTKRLAGGVIGGLKGLLVFFTVELTAICLVKCFGLEILELQIKNSPMFGELSFISQFLISLGIR